MKSNVSRDPAIAAIATVEQRRDAVRKLCVRYADDRAQLIHVLRTASRLFIVEFGDYSTVVEFLVDRMNDPQRNATG